MYKVVLACTDNNSNREDFVAGEVTLTGRVLPIGGVKEKTLAARRSDVKSLIFPAANKRDFDELAGKCRAGHSFRE